jgi:hypothetical protein
VYVTPGEANNILNQDTYNNVATQKETEVIHCYHRAVRDSHYEASITDGRKKEYSAMKNKTTWISKEAARLSTTQQTLGHSKQTLYVMNSIERAW